MRAWVAKLPIFASRAAKMASWYNRVTSAYICLQLYIVTNPYSVSMRKPCKNFLGGICRLLNTHTSHNIWIIVHIVNIMHLWTPRLSLWPHLSWPQVPWCQLEGGSVARDCSGDSCNFTRSKGELCTLRACVFVYSQYMVGETYA